MDRNRDTLGVAGLSRAVENFRVTLKRAKERVSAVESFGWYPYDSLNVFSELDRLFAASGRRFLDLTDNEPIVDLGCGDGEIAFFFESLGYKVQAIDYPPTTINGMRGIRALKEALGSTIEIYEINFDSDFSLPRQSYGLGWCNGVLYHLGNPYRFSQTIARHCRHCMLSTRIFQFEPHSRTNLKDAPVAYLLGAGELNSDHTNYWIFSDAGFKRLIDRTGWSLCDYGTTSKARRPDPVHTDADQRAYCFLRSRIADPEWRIQLLDGWHELEQGSWRWTEPRFTALAPVVNARSCRIRLRFFLPEDHLAQLGSIALNVTVNGHRLPGRTYDTAGMNVYEEPVPSGAFSDALARVEVETDKFAPPSATDQRRRALLIPFFFAWESLRQSVPPLQFE